MLVMHDPENGTIGDCFRCCIASILDMPAIEVPHFCDYAWEIKDARWLVAVNAWLAKRDLAYLEFQADPATPWDWGAFKGLGFSVYHTLNGKSPRGFDHATVGLNGSMVHDPHPSRGGLVGPSDDGVYTYGFIFKRGGA